MTAPTRTVSKREWLTEPELSVCEVGSDAALADGDSNCSCIFPFAYNGRIFAGPFSQVVTLRSAGFSIAPC